MHVLVTGGAGFIGSHLVESLLADGHRVTVVDNYDPFYPRAMKEENLANVRKAPGLRVVEVDVRDASHLEELADSYDSIVHLAAKGGVRPSIADPVAYQAVNVTGTLNVLELARTCGVKQFVFASSSSVYGVNPNTPWREDDHVLLPISPYASTKVSGELMGHVYSHLYGIRFIALRFFTVYGPRQRPDLAIRKFADLIADGKPVTLYGDGGSHRDYTYIQDIISGVRAAMDYSDTAYEIINLGNNRPISLLELVRAIEHVIGKAAKLEFLPEQAGDVPKTCANIDKARALLDYEPKTGMSEGLRRFANWFAGAAHVIDCT